jgi:hypothetical protein
MTVVARRVALTDHLKRARVALRLSQSALARLAGVPRVHVCLHELGDRLLNPQEEDKIQKALQWEAERLRGVDIASPLMHTEGDEQTQESSGGPARPARRDSLGQSKETANLAGQAERDRADRRRRTMGSEAR